MTTFMNLSLRAPTARVNWRSVWVSWMGSSVAGTKSCARVCAPIPLS